MKTKKDMATFVKITDLEELNKDAIGPDDYIYVATDSPKDSKCIRYADLSAALASSRS